MTKKENNGVNTHISNNFRREIEQALKNQLPSNSQVKARDNTPQILVENGVKNLPMLITQNHIKSNRLNLSTRNSVQYQNENIFFCQIKNAVLISGKPQIKTNRHKRLLQTTIC